MIPLYDEANATRGNPPFATWAIVAITSVVFLWQLGIGDEALQTFVGMRGVSPAKFLNEHSLLSFSSAAWTLLSYQFLHGDLLHLAGNMLFLWVFGDNIEDAMGAIRFVSFYLLCGVAGAGAHIASDPGSVTPLIGASGAVAGVLTAYLIVRPCAKVTVLFYGVHTVDAYLAIGAWLCYQVVGLTQPSDVAYWAHLGGACAGALLMILLRPTGVRLFDCVRAQEPPSTAVSADSSIPRSNSA
jgi:membrane associated rhomboid family serine protease